MSDLPEQDWPVLRLSWGPASADLRCGYPQALSWAQGCFTGESVPGLAAGDPVPAAIVVDDDLAWRLADCCTEPLPGASIMPAWCGEADGMFCVKVTVPIARSYHGPKQSWPDVLVYGQEPGGDLRAFCTNDPLGARSGEMLFRQILDRRLYHAGAIVLHTAGVVLDGQALLFAGATGSGKTTLATWGAVMRGGLFLAGDRTAAWLAGQPGGTGGTPTAVGLGVSTRYGEGTLRALIGTEDWLDRLPLPGLNQMMGVDKKARVGKGPFKVVLNNAELGALGIRTAAAAPLAGIVTLGPHDPDAPAGPDVALVSREEAPAQVRPHLRRSFDLLPTDGTAGDWAENGRGYGASDASLDALLDRVPVIRAGWHLGQDDPADLFDAIADCLEGAGQPA
jgi:hypothetical protein